ncbi:helix-turn-helix domain-containing protein [Methylorubrum thiocyanatum]|uniref:helix-turn-helix domain-containing protein n=1 Tax=Methylorubrum thiocyanatum TaxID=47958 RepID=UPI0035C7F307
MSTAAAITNYVRAGLTPAQIRAAYPALSPNTVSSYVKAARRGLTPEERAEIDARRQPAITPPGGQVPFAQRDVLSPEHRRIGIKLARAREADGLALTEFARRHGLNRVRLSGLEQGLIDPSLTELARLAEILGTTVPDLLAPIRPVIRLAAR